MPTKMIVNKNPKRHQNQAVSDESKPLFLFGIIASLLLLFCFETHSCFIEAAEYLVNDDEDDGKQAIEEALSTVNESPSFDVSRV